MPTYCGQWFSRWHSSSITLHILHISLIVPLKFLPHSSIPYLQGLTRQLQRNKTKYLGKFLLYCNSKNRTKKLRVGVFTSTWGNAWNHHQKPRYRPWRICAHFEQRRAASPSKYSLQRPTQPAVILELILVECVELDPQWIQEDWDPDCIAASCAPTAIDGRWPFYKMFWWESWCWVRSWEMLLLARTSDFIGWIGSGPPARHAVAASYDTALRSRSAAYHSHPPSTSSPAFPHQPSRTTPSLSNLPSSYTQPPHVDSMMHTSRRTLYLAPEQKPKEVE